MSIQSPNFQLFRPQQMYVAGRLDDNMGWTAPQIQNPQLVVGKADVGDGQNHYLTLPLQIYTDALDAPGKLVRSDILSTRPEPKPGFRMGTLNYNA